MEKLAYLIHQPIEYPAAELRNSLLEEVVPTLRQNGASQVGVSIEDEYVAEGKAVTIRRADPPVRALITFWMQNSDDRKPCEAILHQHAARLDGYLVVESRPLVHQPPVGERAPGTNLVTTIKKRSDIGQAEFMDLWNEEHKQVALETQSTFGYVRNAIVRALTPNAAPWDGIVEESFPIEALTDPLVWYNTKDEKEYQARLARMIASVTAFLDLENMESTPTSEYWLG